MGTTTAQQIPLRLNWTLGNVAVSYYAQSRSMVTDTWTNLSPSDEYLLVALFGHSPLHVVVPGGRY